MKKFVIGLICGAALSMTTVALASDTIQAILFPSKITFQVKGNQVILDANENPVLNYNDKTYVPLRAFAEAMGASVDFVHGSEATGNLHLITVTSNEYKLIQYRPEDNLSPADNTFYPLTVGLTLPDEYRQNSNQLSIENTTSLMFSVMNPSNDNLLMDPATDLAIEVYAATDNVKGKLVYRYALPPVPSPVPSRSAYTFTVPWSQVDSNGKKIEPGYYIIQLATPEKLEYQVEGSSTVQSVIAYPGMKYGFHSYHVEFK
ncbi:hypothetical protein D3C75_686090 [compost metagenome]